MTVLDVTIEAEHVVKKPGEFYKYAKKYLNVSDPISEMSESWTVKRVIVTPRGVADSKGAVSDAVQERTGSILDNG